MNKLKLSLSYFKEHRLVFRTAVIITIVIVAALFFALREKESDFSGQFISRQLPASEVQSGDEAESDGKTAAAQIYVDIGGQVKNPGVYTVKEGTRVFEVIEKAGGLTEDAFIEQINQAEAVTDGQKIVIPSSEDAQQSLMPQTASGKDSSGLVNINSADSETLQEIPGVGPATAEKIIAYRTENGRFSSIEDLKNVSGIGDKTFEKMKDKITV